MDALKPYQETKKAAEKKILIGGPLAVLAVALFLLVGLDRQVIQILAGLIFLSGVILIIMGSVAFSKMVRTFKTTFLKEKIGEWVENGVYEPDRGLALNEVYQCEFMRHADRFHAEDYIRGSLDGVQFEMCDIKLEERRVEHTKNGTRTYYVPFFTGQFYAVDFNKDFNGALQVLETERPRSKRPFKKIKMESVQFNKIYKTYTTNDHTAFYLITPQMMERMMKIEQDHPGNIGFAFIDNKMYLAIDNNRSLLEVQMFRPLDERRIEAFKQDFQLIKDVIHELKLNQNIFKEIA
jgi:hypothetical protein